MSKTQNEHFASVFTQEKDVEGSEISVKHAIILGHFKIKKEVVLGLLNSIKMDMSPEPDGICPIGLSTEGRGVEMPNARGYTFKLRG
eukprot:g36044.t1